MVPQAFSPKSDKQTKSEARGRPSNMNKAFLKVAEYLQDNDDETDHNLRSSVTTTTHIQLFICREKIKEHFGDEIVITEMHGKSNVVTFRKTAKSMLQQFYTGK